MERAWATERSAGVRKVAVDGEEGRRRRASRERASVGRPSTRKRRRQAGRVV